MLRNLAGLSSAMESVVMDTMSYCEFITPSGLFLTLQNDSALRLIFIMLSKINKRHGFPESSDVNDVTTQEFS